MVLENKLGRPPSSKCIPHSPEVSTTNPPPLDEAASKSSCKEEYPLPGICRDTAALPPLSHSESVEKPTIFHS
ncbi:putative vacuolar protein sorting-associated protein 2 [Sesbania bispinosa]|nr:putative vacuolar protein sorting-associated protein 2 [Sesbania bispinosa]